MYVLHIIQKGLLHQNCNLKLLLVGIGFFRFLFTAGEDVSPTGISHRRKQKTFLESIVLEGKVLY